MHATGPKTVSFHSENTLTMNIHLIAPLLVITATVMFNQPAAAQPRPGSARAVADVPQGVKAHRDLAYVVNGHERQKLDLFVPEKADGPLPLIIWIHGGGWQNGSKEGCPPLRNGYTGRGYAVASINYRLSGHAIFPAQIEDCKAAIRWLRAHAKEYSLDPQRFGVWGSSAGGHLVALLGTSGDVKEFDVGREPRPIEPRAGGVRLLRADRLHGVRHHARLREPRDGGFARGQAPRRRGDGEQGQGRAREPHHLRQPGRSAVPDRAWRQGSARCRSTKASSSSRR